YLGHGCSAAPLSGVRAALRCCLLPFAVGGSRSSHSPLLLHVAKKPPARDHSGLPPTALRIGVQRASSSWKTPAALSGPTPCTGSKPSLTSSLWKSPSAGACWVTALIRS